MLEALKYIAPTLFENSFQGNALVTSEGRFMYVNGPVCQLLGYNESELKLKHWQEITHPEDVDPDEEMAHRVREGRISLYDIDKRYIKKDGKVVAVKLRVCAVKDETGKFICYLSMMVPSGEKPPTGTGMVTTKEVGKVLTILSWSIDKAPLIASALIGAAAIIYYVLEYVKKIRVH